LGQIEFGDTPQRFQFMYFIRSGGRSDLSITTASLPLLIQVKNINSNAENPQADNLVKQSIFLYVSLYCFIFFKFITGFIVAKLLGPSLYGLRTIFGLVVEYSAFSHLGTFNAMRREVPFYRGRNDEHYAKIIVDNVFGINLIYSIFVGLFSIAAGFYMLAKGYEGIYVDFAIFLGAYTLAEKILYYYVEKLTVDKNTSLLTTVNLLKGATYIAACVPLTYFFSLRGLLIGLVLACASVDLYIYLKTRELPGILISFQVVWKLIKIGFPIMLIGLTFIILASIDRVIIATMLSKEMLGYYSIGTIISGVIYAGIYQVSGIVLGPRIMEKLGKTNDIKQLKNYFFEPTMAIGALCPLVIACAFFTIDLIIKYFLFEYAASIIVVKILLVSSFFISISVISVQIAIALSSQMKVVGIMAFTIVLNGILSYTAVIYNFGIRGVALGTGLSYFLFGILCLLYILQSFDAALKHFLEIVVKVYLPFAFYVCVMVLIDMNVLQHINGFWNEALCTLTRIFIFFICYSPMIFINNNYSAFKKSILKTERSPANIV